MTRARGNPTEDETLFASLYSDLWRFANIVKPPEASADDLVMEAVAKALRSRRLAELDDAGKYLRTAIARLSANERRRLGRQR